MKIKFFIFCLFIFSLSTIASDIIKGNEKTQTRLIEKLISKCEEDHTSSLEQCLLNSRLFSEVKIYEKEGRRIVDVKDRWSLIPYPSLNLKSTGSKSYGLFLFDANFMGLGTLLGVGGSFSNTSSSYTLFYKDKSFLLSDWTLGFSLGKNNADVYWKNKNLKEIDAFHEKTSHNSFSIGHNLTNHFNLETSFTRRFSSFEALKNYDIPQEYHSYLLRLQASYSKENFKFYFADGFRLIGSIDQEISRSDKSEKTRFLNFNYLAGKETFRKEALLWSAHFAFLEGGDKRDALKSGRRNTSGRGLRGIPEGGYFTHFIGTLSLDYQIPLRFTQYGTWTLAPFVDWGKINGYKQQSEDLWQKAYGIGSYFFLKGIMLPGVGFIIGKNETFKSGFAELSIGETF